MIAALKAGVAETGMIDGGSSVTGAVWYHPILTSNPCSNGKPSGIEGAEDAVNFAVLMPLGTEGGTVNVYSNGAQIGSVAAGAGLNMGKVLGLGVGGVDVDVLDGGGNVLVSVNGTVPVSGEDDPQCNFNFVVQGF